MAPSTGRRPGGPRGVHRGGSPDGLATGEAGWTTAGLMQARWVIHVVGPNQRAGERDRALLTSCYVSALAVADELGARTRRVPAGLGRRLRVAEGGRRRRGRGGAGGSADTQVEEARMVAFDEASYELIRRTRFH